MCISLSLFLPCFYPATNAHRHVNNAAARVELEWNSNERDKRMLSPSLRVGKPLISWNTDLCLQTIVITVLINMIRIFRLLLLLHMFYIYIRVCVIKRIELIASVRGWYSFFEGMIESCTSSIFIGFLISSFKIYNNKKNTVEINI